MSYFSAEKWKNKYDKSILKKQINAAAETAKLRIEYEIGMSKIYEDIERTNIDLTDKQSVINWMMKKNIDEITQIKFLKYLKKRLAYE